MLNATRDTALEHKLHVLNTRLTCAGGFGWRHANGHMPRKGNPCLFCFIDQREIGIARNSVIDFHKIKPKLLHTAHEYAS